MSLPSRIKNIAISQLHAITERLERIELESSSEIIERKSAEAEAREEVKASLEPGAPRRRTPEEIAAGVSSRISSTGPASVRPATRVASQESPIENPLAIHYRVLGLTEGADFSSVQQAYLRLCARCSSERFDEGSAEQAAAAEIKKRVQMSYDALKDVLDSTTGRFDKLEL